MPALDQQRAEAHLRRESGPGGKVGASIGCWPSMRGLPALEPAKLKDKDTAQPGKLHVRRKSFALWGGKRDASADAADAAVEPSTSRPEHAASSQDDALDSLPSQLFDLDLSSQLAEAPPPAKGASKAAAQPPALLHKRGWSFGRKVAPAAGAVAPEPTPAPASSSVLLDTSQSDESLGMEGSVASSSSPPSTLPSAAAAAEQAKGAQGYRRLWQSITSVRKGDAVTAQPVAMPDVTVEGLCRAVQRLKLGRPVMEAVQGGLPFLDSRAVAALLKELSKCGLPHRSAELFDWLRSLPPEDPLAKLADLYTYTTIISQCGGHQQLRRALELVGEMRARGIRANIHTYSALMSVCVKCNECDLALDVYQQLLAEGCTPNLVTSNILIDIHGKTGQWERAVEVLDSLQEQGTAAEPRTYNTVINACAKSGQPAAAFQVYQRMLSDGVSPTSTTYTTLISAYGKAGQVEEALRVYEDMSVRGCERNVITYSSLISACDRAGRCDLALRLFVEMQRVAGVRPNVVTYNGVISACGQAGLWQKSAELFDAMLASGCRPDAVSYSVLIAAYERGGQWQRALQTFERMCQQFRPDACVYNCVLEALWASGMVSAQGKAVQLAGSALRQGHLRLTSLSLSETTATAHSYAAVFVALQRWLWDLREQRAQLAAAGARASARPSLLLTRGKHSRGAQSYAHIGASLATMFRALSAPLTAEPGPQGLSIVAESAAALAAWLPTAGCTAMLSPTAAAAGGQVVTAALLHEDAAAEAQCAPAFAAVLEFEAGHRVRSDAYAAPAVAALRQELVTALLSLGQGLQLADEITCEGIQLCDRLLIRGAAPPALDAATAPTYAAGALLACARGAGAHPAVLCGQHVLLQLAGVSLASAVEAEQQLSAALLGDVAAISPLRVLHLYLERLGCSLLSLQECELTHLMALTAADLASKAALSPAFVRYPPSLVAAACLAKARQGLGLHPAWPTSLANMTGYSSNQEAFATCCEVIEMLGLAAA